MTTLSDGDAETSLEGRRALDLLQNRRLVVLTGAGLSTDSGIPDYRGPHAPVRLPMTFQEFVSGHAAQQRYWARSHIGWSRMKGARPNAGHFAIAAIDPALLITQNVDGLHELAGSRNVVDLHGRLSEVVCLDCGDVTDRAAFQARLDALNPGWIEAHAEVVMRPDGDVEVEDTAGFVVPVCERCSGRLKPNVVFFGENAAADRVATSFAAVDALRPEDGALLVAGTSLTVMSGLRFVRRAAKAEVPVVIVNHGHTRGDELAILKVETGTSEFLVELERVRVS